MIPNDTPWSGLEPGKIDTRRVDASANWNWFWAVLPRSDVALLLKLSSLPDPPPDLPNLKNLEIRFQTLPGGPILYIRLKDNAQLELFETLCRDVMASGELADTEAEAIDRAIARTFRWHYLLRGGKQEALGEDAQKGLIGEIEVLKLLFSTLGTTPALTAWTGPSGAPKDFELNADCIEVKTRRGASQPFVKIANEYQLADVPDRRLWLGVLAVDKVHAPHGRTLTEFVAEVTDHLQQTDHSAIALWDLHLADAGFDTAHDYSAWRWIVSEPQFHVVTEGFPRIVAPVPQGVSDLTYSIALSTCTPFQADWSTLRSKLVEEDQP